jgi:hypothetical protein
MAFAKIPQQQDQINGAKIADGSIVSHRNIQCGHPH